MGDLRHPTGRASREQRNWIERTMSVVTEVRAGEGTGVLLLGLNVFLLLLAYYLLRPVREALILTEAGAEARAYSAAGQAVLFMGIVPLYGMLASRLNRIQLITWVTLFFISNLILFWILGNAGVPLGIPFYLWVGIFNMLVIAQFWAFANDLYTEASGKRLFPLIMLGASLGAVAGGQVAARLFATFGAYGLMLLSGALLGVCILVSHFIDRRARTRPRLIVSGGTGGSDREAERPLDKTGAFQLLLQDRYLLWIAVLMVLLNTVNTTGEYILARFVQETAAASAGSPEAQQVIVGRFYGDYASLFSAVGLFLQVFAVSRIFKFLGVGPALLFLPVIALAGYSMLIFFPVLGVVRWAKIFENGTDYSIQNTARQALFLPTSREAKYKAKAAIDTFFVRAGDMLQAGIIYVGAGVLSLGVEAFAAVNIVFTVLWLMVAVRIGQEYQRRTHSELRRAPTVTVQRAPV